MSTVEKGSRLRGYTCLLLSLLLASSPIFAQAQSTVAEPQREQLLNGLRVLIWPRPGNQDLTIKLRLHSGAAFDLAGKSGEMCLLGDILFPDPATVEFFTEEMSGKLDVFTDHDSMTITMQGRASEFERIVEILRNALVSTRITPDIVARQRERRMKIVKDSSVSPAIVADRAIGARFFGDFPYGRPANGSAEDLARVDRPDLMLARERFLNPNNATLTIVGGVERNRAIRALRQLLGSWRKSEQIVPATFRHAIEPDTRTLIINGPADQTAEVRLAVRGLARSDPDYNTASILAIIGRQRWQSLTPEFNSKPFFVRNEAHMLPGMFVMGASINSKSTAAVISNARKVTESLVKVTATPEELDGARNELIVQLTNQLAKLETLPDVWLDIETFRLPPVTEQLQGLRSITAADAQRVATRLFKDAPIASIVLGEAQQLKAELEGHFPTEMMGEIAKPAPSQQEIKPPTKPNIATKP
jgi:zinc protease